MDTVGRLDPAVYLEHVRADAERFASIVEAGPLDAPVAGCPGWDLGALAAHLGDVHRWVVECVVTGERPTGGDHVPPVADDPVALAAWIREGAAALLATLQAAELDAPTWHPFPVERIVRVWPRRQAHENAIHRWDAETAVGAAATIDATLASDGIDEYFELVLPRLVAREGIELPAGTVHVHCTDVPGEWLVAVDGRRLVVRREHAKGDAALRGPAEALLLRLWNRGDADGAVDVIGDRDVAGAWLALTGL